MQAPLEKVLEYRNENVISSFLDSFDISEDEALDIFVEMLRFLWFSNISDGKEFVTIDHPLIILDEMWHQFILTTKDYNKFCKEYFGKYIHHSPTTKADKARFLQEK